MLKKTIKYEDFNGDEVEEDFYFHLSKAELVELEMSQEGGMSAWLENVVAAQDGKTIITEFKKIVLSAYGKRSPDGKRFIKNQDLRDEFESTEAYSVLFVELVTDAEKAAEFVNGVIPANMAEEAAKLAAGGTVTELKPKDIDTEIRTLTSEEFMALSREEQHAFTLEVSKGNAKLEG